MSQSRRCDIFKAADGKWYVRLGDFEYAQAEEDCTCYGPFPNEDSAMGELDRHSNPGAFWTDPSGEQPIPRIGGRPSYQQTIRRRWA